VIIISNSNSNFDQQNKKRLTMP